MTGYFLRRVVGPGGQDTETGVNYASTWFFLPLLRGQSRIQPKNYAANCRKCCNHPFLFNGAEAAMRDTMHAECDDTIVRCAGVWCGAVAKVVMMCVYARGVNNKS